MKLKKKEITAIYFGLLSHKYIKQQ